MTKEQIDKIKKILDMSLSVDHVKLYDKERDIYQNYDNIEIMFDSGIVYITSTDDPPAVYSLNDIELEKPQSAYDFIVENGAANPNGLSYADVDVLIRKYGDKLKDIY